MFKFNRSSGQVSRLLLVLAVIVLVAVIITFLIMRMATKPAAPAASETNTEIPQPVYETSLGNIKFVFESAIDKGSTLKVSDIINSQYMSNSQQKSLSVSNPGAKFVQVIVGAQNIGTMNTEQGAWTLGNIIDSQGRNFVPLDGYIITPWTPYPDLCGSLLKPAFDPTPCMKVYEVSKQSTGLKIIVVTGQDNTSSNLSSGKIQSDALDLIIK